MRRSGVGAGLVILLLGAALATSACGGASHDNGVATAGGVKGAPKPASGASADPTEQRRQFAQCMRDHGIDMADPDPNGGLHINGNQKVDQDKLKVANQACLRLLPGGGQPPKFNATQVEQLREFSRCLRDHGLDVPDPDPVTGLIPVESLSKLDRDSKQFKDAELACQNVRPTFMPRIQV
jgi:hypothetical protein